MPTVRSVGLASADQRSNLPAHRPSLIGRDEEAVVVRERLIEAKAGILTLTGAGGCGKSSLAVYVAHGLLDAFADGVWLVELAPLSDAPLIDTAVAAALGVRERGQRSLREGLQEFLRPRSLLLVLDNCEHLIDACARLAATLLEMCPELRILATSREPLRTPGEVTWRVPSLPAPDPEHLSSPDELGQYAAVRLFVERAQAVRHGFALRAENAPAVAQVCARLEGMPLALELAAARTQALAVSQIAARLDESLRLLVGGSRTAHSRQRTLEATIDWSFDLLTEVERVLLARLSVFAGGFDLPAAEAVGGGNVLEEADVVDVLTELVNKSLVLAEERPGETRYRLLEPIRQYARERLAARGEEATIRSHHATYFRTLAERAEPALWGPDQATWLARLERDHANLRAALKWVHESAEDMEAERRFAVALSRFWHTRGELSEGRTWLRRALEAPPAAATPGWATGLTWEAALAHHQGDIDEAVALSERAVAASRELGEPVILGLALVTLGDNLTRPGDVGRAIAALDEGVTILRAAGDQAGPSLAVGLGILGTVLRMAGEFDRAAKVLEEGLAVSRTVGNSWAVGIALQDLAQVARERGDNGWAGALFRECLAVAHDLTDTRRVAECLEGFAELAVGAGRAERAARLLGSAKTLRDTNGSTVEPVDRPIYDSSIATARQALGDIAFSAAWDTGQATPLGQVLEEALEEAATASGTSVRSDRWSQPSHGLTAREREVAALVARGLTNPQIATRLVISRRTADRHVSNILDKLGFTTRGQVAAWAFEQGISAPHS
jgi:predicted ATPase/DNA-binding CsgD family transcriptional regulator